MKKYAILIFAHTKLSQLQTLCNALDSKYFDIYIHIDKRNGSDLKIVAKYSKVHIFSVFKIHWAGFSFVLAYNYLLDFASKQNDYARYIILSGLDYPIKSNAEIYKVLQNDNEYIIGKELEANDYHKVNRKYLFDMPFLNKFLAVIHKIKPYNKKHYRKIKLKNGEIMKVYFATTWVGLTNDFVRYYLNFIKRHNEILKFFKRTYGPDELLVPTVVFNSKFRHKALGQIHNQNLHYNCYSSMHYLNYEPEIEVYDENSFDKIINSDKLFVRKVVLPKSKLLIKKIDKYRNANKVI